MFIQTEATPNPATLKFLPGRPVLDNGTLDMPTREAAAQSPLAEKLFDLPNVGGVFYGTKRANPSPRWFGFHEVFHAFTLGGFASHFAAVTLAVVGYQAVS